MWRRNACIDFMYVEKEVNIFTFNFIVSISEEFSYSIHISFHEEQMERTMKKLYNLGSYF